MSMQGSPVGNARGGGVLGSGFSAGAVATIVAAAVLLIVVVVSLFGDATTASRNRHQNRTRRAVERARPARDDAGARGRLLTANGAVIATGADGSVDDGPIPPSPPAAQAVIWRDRSTRRPAPKIAIIGRIGSRRGGYAGCGGRLPGGSRCLYALWKLAAGLVSTARANGHEVLPDCRWSLRLPQQRSGAEHALTGLQAGENPLQLRWLMSRDGHAGFVNSQGAKFLSSSADVKWVLQETKRRGLFLIDNGETEQSIAREMAGEGGAAFARADLQIDRTPIREAIEREFAALETLAKERGMAIGVAGAFPVTIDRVSVWAESLEQKGIALAPVSALIDARPIVKPAPAVNSPAGANP
jgi:polysaccharide deacetylase 2 family uncharacterized protein YibQ